MNSKEVKALKDELLSRVNPKSRIQLEKVERYINLVDIYYRLDKSIKDDGIMIKTINGSQEFTKPNPAIAEKNKINTSLIALGKDLGLDTPVKPSGESGDDGKDDLI